MKIRTLSWSDETHLRELNARYYPDDAFPNFEKNFASTIAIVDDDDHIITAGGVEVIAEGVCITDQKFSEHVKGKALRMLLGSMLLTCGRIHQNYLLVSINGGNTTWERALQGDGFKLLNSKVLYKKVNHG